MKKHNLLIATLLVVAAASVAVVSCKKETQNALQTQNAQSAKTFAVPQVDDMCAYLKNFKQKMKESQYAKDAEMLSLEEAAWHLSSIANYDFANANVRYTDLRYDTLQYQVNVTNGQVSLSDLNNVYQNMANDIDAFYQNLDLQEKHFRFIGANITEDGQVEASLITSYFTLDHTWFFPDEYYADSVCYALFGENGPFYFPGNFDTELINALNILYSPNFLPIEQRKFYIYTKTEEPLFLDYIDSYGSPNVCRSRIFATQSYNTLVSLDQIYYCLDSYLGLGQSLQSSNEEVINWSLSSPHGDTVLLHDHLHTWYHKPSIRYGTPLIPVNDGNDY